MNDLEILAVLKGEHHHNGNEKFFYKWQDWAQTQGHKKVRAELKRVRRQQKL